MDETILMVAVLPRDTGRAEDVSSEMCIRARLAGAEFSKRSGSAGFSDVAAVTVSSLSPSLALDWVRFRVFFAGLMRPGWALKEDGWLAIESIFLNSAM